MQLKDRDFFSVLLSFVRSVLNYGTARTEPLLPEVHVYGRFSLIRPTC